MPVRRSLWSYGELDRERATGVEPATSSLGSWHSTTELRPRRRNRTAVAGGWQHRLAGALSPPASLTARTPLPTIPRSMSAASGAMQVAIREVFEASARARDVFLAENASGLERAITLVARALADGRKVLLFGNGGSAADAQHIASEFVGRFLRERRPLPAIALTTDTS